MKSKLTTMLNKTQKQLLKALKEKWSQVPQQRFGQFLFNYTRIGTRAGIGKIEDPFWYEDKEILEDLTK